MNLPSRITAYLVAGGIAAGLLFYGFGRLAGILGAHDAQITAASQAQLKLHPALLKWRAKLANAQRTLTAQAVANHRTADSLRAALARGERVDTVVVLQEIITQDSTAYARCSLALTACEQRARSAEQEADSLSRRLTAQLTVHDRRWGVVLGGGLVGSGRGMGFGGFAGVAVRLWP